MTQFTLTELDPRTYQQTAVEWSRQRDACVVCLPTGSGKTLVGCQWACSLLTETDIDRILVVEPSRYLVEQTAEYFDQHTTIPTEKLYGTTPSQDREGRWNSGRVVVTTPQTAYNDLEWLDFDAAIVDECHHTTGQHAFANLMREYCFDNVLGLSATIPRSKESEITDLIGEIHRWTWQDLPEKHVPEWIGEVYDTPYPDAYASIVDELENFRMQWQGSSKAGLATLGIRMLCRDGGLALSETLRADTKMGDLMADTLLPHLDSATDLHKLSACHRALEDHEFDKAVLFVDRVVVAKQLAEAFDDYNTVTVLGRLQSSSEAQQEAVTRAQADETDLIIATAAGEEGMDLPKADLLIVWSNVVSAVRFIQRLGRVMRKREREQPKAAVYLATPESPDYTSLRRGIVEAESAGLDISRLDDNLILNKTEAGQLRETLSAGPQRHEWIAQTLQQPQTKVENWLRTLVREGEVCYLYHVPDDLDEWRSPSPFTSMFGEVDNTQEAAEVRNNLSPNKEYRYYVNEDDLPVIETEYPELISGDRTHRLKISFGPSHQKRDLYTAYGTPDSVVDSMLDDLGEFERFYAQVSYSSRRPTYSFQMIYQGSPTETVISTIARNADAIATTLENSQQLIHEDK